MTTPVAALPTPVPSTADPTNFDTRADAFLGALPQFVTDVNDNATLVNGYATAASSSATTASTMATTATTQAGIATDMAATATTQATTAVNAPGTQATSTSTKTPAIGSWSLTLAQTGKTFTLGQWVSISSIAGPTSNWMVGAITAFTSSTGAMTVNVTQAQGSSSLSSWAVLPTSPYNIPIPVGSILYTQAIYGIF